MAQSQNPAPTPNAPTPQTVSSDTAASSNAAPSLRLDIPHSWNPVNAYRASLVPRPDLVNSSRIDALIKNGILELSLKDAIALALENNLDLAIARYNIPIAQADILRTQAGGSFRGVNTGVVQNTPGGGVGGFGSGAAGAGAGGTSGGAGGAGAGASGLVSSTLGTGTNVSSYDPTISAQFNLEHYTEPLANTVVYGVPTLQQHTSNGNIEYAQAFPTGGSIQVILDNQRFTNNSPSSLLNPTLNGLQFSRNCFLVQGLGPTFDSCELPRIIRRSPMKHSNFKWRLPLPRLQICIGISLRPTRMLRSKAARLHLLNKL
jgi:hypothetical protein